MFNSFFKDNNSLQSDSLFFSQSNQLAHESPELKLIQGDFVYGVSTPRILTTQTLGDVFGSSSPSQREVLDYKVQEGDTVSLIAQAFRLTPTTIALANNISTNSKLSVGQTLAILPVDGILHAVKSGDTISAIAKTYKVNADDIVAFNNLASQSDIFAGDVLIIPGGVMPAKSSGISQVQLSSSFFIHPAEGRITQGLHYYNAVDLANQCGTPIYAAASGTVQRVTFDYRYGNYITILHNGGVVTYYGHLQAMFVKSGDRVNVGDRIALMGRTGTEATGCHVHFEVVGAKNPLASYYVGTTLGYK